MSKTGQEKVLFEQLNNLNGKIKFMHTNYKLMQRQTFAIIKIGTNYYTGTAVCSMNDNFSRKVGRAISFSRAMKNYDIDNPAEIANQFKFKEDQIKNEIKKEE